MYDQAWFEQIDRLITDDTGRGLPAVHGNDFRRFYRLWDQCFNEQPFTPKQKAYLAEFERRALRASKGGPWVLKAVGVQKELFGE